MTTRHLVNAVLESSRSSRELRRALAGIPRNKMTVLKHVVHYCAHHDNLPLLERIIPSPTPAHMRPILHAPLGRHGYTPLCIAAYAGSDRMTRYLITQGADVNYTNIHGEDLATNLDMGEKQAIHNRPNDTIFIRERFRCCRTFIRDRQLYLQREAKRPAVNYTPRKPRRVTAAIKIWAWWTKLHK